MRDNFQFPTLCPGNLSADFMKTALPVLPAPAGAPTSRRTRWTLLLASMLTVMSGATIAPSLPGMLDHFAGEPSAELLVRLVLTIAGLSIAVSAPLTGFVIDRHGRRPVLVAALALFALAGASGALTQHLSALLVGRLLLGVAVGAIMTATSTMIVDLFSDAQRSRMIALQAVFMALAGVVFMPIGGVLATIDWRAPFLIYLTGLPMVPLALALPRRERAVARASAETRHEQPVPWGPVVLLCGCAFCFMLAFFQMPTQLPFLLEQLRVGPARVGVLLGAMTLTTALAALLYSRRAGRHQVLNVLVIGLLLFAFGWGLIAAAVHPRLIVVGLALGGIGSGLVNPAAIALMSSLAPEWARGRVLSAFTGSLFLAQFVSPFAAHPFLVIGGIPAVFAAASALIVLVAAVVLAYGRFGASGLASRTP